MIYKTIFNKKIKVIVIILLCLSLFGIVSADTTNPPSSIKIMGYLSTHNQTGVWWKNPTDFDFAGTQIWFDNVYIETSTVDFKYWEFLSLGDHTFSTHTIDTSSNINNTWTNITIINNNTCYEEWFSDGWCESPPSSSFDLNVTSGLYILPVQFTDTSTLNATAWNWSFGDGTFSDLQNPPVKEYSNGGVYKVNLTAWNTNATKSSSTNNVEVWNRTSNDFTANTTGGGSPLTVEFTDISYNATSWYWMFGGSEGTSTSQNPVHTYIFNGVYTVNHSSSNAHHTYWTNKSYYITVSSFGDLIPPESIHNLSYTLKDYGGGCGNQIDWSWNNPDDPDFYGISVWRNNTFLYNLTFGETNIEWNDLDPYTSYTISTKSFDAAGNVNDTWINQTAVTSGCTSPLVADFTITQNSTCIPSSVILTSTSYSAAGISNFYWNVTDGGNGVDFTTENVELIYLDAGDFLINLTVVDVHGNSSSIIKPLNTYDCNVTPTPVPTTLVPGNVSQPQQPSQTSGNYSDIRIWFIMFIGSLIAMVLARDTNFNTLRPAIFGVISFIFATASVWMSLSIAYMGDFAIGGVMKYTNQTTQQVYYYQVIQVVANPVVTIICVIIFIFVILNCVDIGYNYIQRANVIELQEFKNRRERFGDKIRSVGGEIRKDGERGRDEVRGKLKK